MSKLTRNGNKDAKESGITLLEILIVLAILALIAMVAVPNLMKIFGSAKQDVALIQLENLKASLDIYKLENGSYPSEEQGLEALVAKPDSAPPTWNGPYIDKPEALMDPWGNPYHYRQPGADGPYDLFSLGADNAEGGEGEDADIHG